MRYLEVRRHAMRVKPGDHLSQVGVTLARKVGDTMGAFALVVTSDVPRAFETAIAMGFAVDEQLHGLADEMGAAVEQEVAWDAGFAAFAHAVTLGRATADYAQRQADLWRNFISQIPNGFSALAISHGGIIEAGAVACLPAADHVSWGGACGYCEGGRLEFDGEKWVGVEVLRVKQPQ
jgi:broad specificity phosphatase PhoE